MGKQGQSWVWGLEGSKKDSCHELILSMCQVGLFFHFTDEGTEAQRGSVTCSRSHSKMSLPSLKTLFILVTEQ